MSGGGLCSGPRSRSGAAFEESCFLGLRPEFEAISLAGPRYELRRPMRSRNARSTIAEFVQGGADGNSEETSLS